MICSSMALCCCIIALSKLNLVKTIMSHSGLTVYELSQYKNVWTLPLLPNDVAFTVRRFHTMAGVRKGEVRREWKISKG